MTEPVFYTWTNSNTVILEITTQPGASKNEVSGLLGGRLKVRVKAIPENGKANEAVCKFLGEIVEIPASYCKITKGFTSRHKTFSLSPITPESFQKLLNLIPENQQMGFGF